MAETQFWTLPNSSGWIANDEIIENYSSAIWTDRYDDCGDFQITAPLPHPLLENMELHTMIGRNDSDRVCVVERTEKRYKDKTITIKGRSVEKILATRTYTDFVNGPNTNGKAWSTTYSPADVAMYVARYVIGDWADSFVSPLWGFNNPPTNMTFTNSAGAASTAEPITTGTEQALDIIKRMCVSDGLGFRMRRIFNTAEHIETSTFNFNIYNGADRTASVIFSPELDNLDDVVRVATAEDQVHSILAYDTSDSYWSVWGATKNSYVLKNGFALTTIPQDVSQVRGLRTGAQRRAYVDGIVGERRERVIVEGKVVPTQTNYVYGTHYFLGDKVGLMIEGETFTARVAEVVTSIDNDGKQIYPVLTVL